MSTTPLRHGEDAVHAILAEARAAAELVGVPWDDLSDELPQREVALIRDRISRRLLALRDELHGLQGPRRQQRLAA
jgi:hypothetical protein